MIRYHLDEHIHGAIAAGLRRRGIDVCTPAERGLIGASDEHELADATAQGRVFVTQDDDYLRLHATGMEHAGIVFCHPKRNRVGYLVLGLTRLWRTRSADEIRRRVEFL